MALALALQCLSAPALAETGTVTLPASTQAVEDEAFYGDTSVRRAVLPEGIRKIGERAFAKSGLTEIDLPASLTDIADDAFEDCPADLAITAPRGSYGYRWACRKNLIPYVRITSQTEAYDGYNLPASHASMGETVTFRVKAENAREYRWERTKNLGEDWEQVDGDADSCRVTVDETSEQYVYRCVVYGVCGDRVCSNGARIIMKAKSLTILDKPVCGKPLDSNGLTLTLGEEYALGYSLTPPRERELWVTWTSSDRNVATVSDDGRVTAHEPGSTTITAMWQGRVEDTCKVTVREADASAPASASRELTDYLGYRYDEAAGLLGVDESCFYYDKQARPTPVYFTYTPEGYTSSQVLIMFNIGAHSRNGEIVDGVEICQDDTEAYTIGGVCTGMNESEARATLEAAGWTLSETEAPTEVYERTGDNGTVYHMSHRQGNRLNAWAIDPAEKSLTRRTVQFNADVRNADDTLQVECGGSRPLTAEVLVDGVRSDEGVDWSSSDTSIATVDRYGNVTGRRVGSATVKAAAQADNGVYKACTVYVYPSGTDGDVLRRQDVLSLLGMNAEAVGQDPAYDTLELGSSSHVGGSVIDYFNYADDRARRYRVDGICIGMSWSDAEKALKGSSAYRWAVDTTVLDRDGLYRRNVKVYRAPVGAGEYVIFVNLDRDSKVHAICGEWLQSVKAQSIVLKDCTIRVGETRALTAEILPRYAANHALAWHSDDPTVAHVDPSAGTVTGRAEGSTTVTAAATDGSGACARCTVTVAGTETDNPVTCRALLVCIEGNEKNREQDVGFSSGTVNMRSVLFNRRGPGGGAWQITAKKNLTQAEILAATEAAFGDADDNDVSMFFITTHGAHLLAGAASGQMSTRSEPLPLETLAARLKEIRGTVIVIIDTCGSGAAVLSAFDGTSVKAASAATDGQPAPQAIDKCLSAGLRVPNKFYVITASAYHETAKSTLSLGTWLMRWLSDAVGTSGPMPGDADGDGGLSLREFQEWAAEKNRKANCQHVQIYPADSDFVFLTE